MIITAEKLMTAEEFGELPDDGSLTELIRGKVVPMNIPYPRHGQICSKIDRVVGASVENRNLGHLLTNDSGVITERGPDTVRGPDVAYYSYNLLPPGPLPHRYLSVVPELVFEVRSATDRWPKLLAKVAEFLDAGVKIVCVLDDQTQAAHIYPADDAARIVAGDAELTLPEVFPDFRVPVSRFFE